MASDQTGNDPSATAGNRTVSRRKLLAGIGAIIGASVFEAGCSTNTANNGGNKDSSPDPKPSVESLKPKTPFELYSSAIPPELKERLDTMKAKTPEERRKAPWSEQTLYALNWALELELTGKIPSSFVDTKIGTTGESLQDHTPRRSPLTLQSNPHDIHEQNAYFVSLMASLGTRDTQRDMLPLAGVENSPAIALWSMVITNNEPGWILGQVDPVSPATSGDIYTTMLDGNKVTRRDLTITSPNTGKSFTRTVQFEEMPLLNALSALGPTAEGIGDSARGIWLSVEDH